MRIGIVGCGVVGAYLGWKLAEGNEVTIFERKDRIGKEACSGLISERLWEFLPENRELVLNRPSHVRINFPKKKATLKFVPAMMVIDRPGLDRYAAALAKRSGARILLGHEVKKLFLLRGKKPQVSFSSGGRSGAEEFDYVIGCDGPLSIVRRQMGLKDPRMRLGVMFYKKDKNSKGDVINTWPTRHGFSWMIPRGTCTEYGVIETPKDAKREFGRLKRRFRAGKAKAISALIPEGPVLSNDPRVALCGDAAGLTKHWSGGGVIWGLTSAEMLAKAFPNLTKYCRMVERKFAAAAFYSRAVTGAINFAGNRLPFLVPKETSIDSDWLI